MKIYVSAKLEVGCSFPSIWVRRLVTVAELLQELIIGLPKLQAVQSIPRVGRQLNRRELSNALRHRIRTHRIICPYSSMDCQLGGLDLSIAVRTTQCIWQTRGPNQENGPFRLRIYGTPRTMKRSGDEADREDLLRVILKAELRCIRLPLVRPADAPLHFVLYSIERLDLDQRVVFPALDPPVQSREPAIHGVAEDVRDRLAGPRAAGLRPVSVAVQLLADFRDPLSLEIPAEDQRDDTSLLLLHLEDSVHVVVAVRARIGQERIRFLHRAVQRLRALLAPRPANHLALVQVPLHAQLLESFLLRFGGVVLQKLAGGSEPHVHFPEQEGVDGGSVRTVLAQHDLLLPDRGIRARVRVDLMAHEALRGPATLTPPLHGSSLRDEETCIRICSQVDGGRAGIG